MGLDVTGMVVIVVARTRRSSTLTAKLASAWTARRLLKVINALKHSKKHAVQKNTKAMEIAMITTTTVDVPGMVATAVALPSARSTARSASAWTAQQKHHLETRVSSLPRKVAVSLSTKEMEIAMMKITTLDATGTVVTAVAIKSKKLTAKCACASTAPRPRNARRKERPADLVLTKVMATAMMLTISVVVTGTVATAVAPRLRRNTAKYANA